MFTHWLNKDHSVLQIITLLGHSYQVWVTLTTNLLLFFPFLCSFKMFCEFSFAVCKNESVKGKGWWHFVFSYSQQTSWKDQTKQIKINPANIYWLCIKRLTWSFLCDIDLTCSKTSTVIIQSNTDLIKLIGHDKMNPH